jgi:hypothetical protein
MRVEGMALACLHIACKLEEIKAPSLRSIVSCVDTCTEQDIIKFEEEALKVSRPSLINLDFKLESYNPYLRFLVRPFPQALVTLQWYSRPRI